MPARPVPAGHDFGAIRVTAAASGRAASAFPVVQMSRKKKGGKKGGKQPVESEAEEDGGKEEAQLSDVVEHGEGDDEQKEEAGGDESLGREGALSHLADEIGMEPEQLRYLADNYPDQFGGIEHLSKQDIKADITDWTKLVSGLEWKDKNMPTSGGGRSSSGWATNKVRKAAQSLIENEDTKELFPGGSYSLHHKISKQKLRLLHTKMVDSGNKAAPLTDALDMIGQDAGAQSPLKVLLNMPGNLELGPASDRRLGDPGSGFDPNPGTPRSQMLARADSEIDSKSPDWDHLAGLFLGVHQKHREMSGGEVLTPPLAGQWKKGKAGKFVRENQ